MDSTVTLTFRYDEIDYVRAVRADYATRLRLRPDLAVAAGVAVFGTYLSFSSGSRWLGIACVLLAAAFGFMLFVAFVIIPPVAFRREPKFRDEYTLTFSPEGIRFQTAHIDSQLQWSLYSRALIDKHSYILYYGSRQFSVVPKRVFQSSEQQQAFEKLLIDNVAEIVRR
ncbi:MAG: YcxB family protein [Planctomycetes bacterium]|nr:YcxB family protein [Planctomycetota bacterium]